MRLLAQCQELWLIDFYLTSLFAGTTMATDLKDFSSLSSGETVAMPYHALPVDDGRALDSYQINPRVWATAFVAGDIVSLALLCVPAFNIGHVMARYGILDPSGQFLSLALLGALYIAISLATRVCDTAKIFDLGHSARRLALSGGVTFAAVLAAHNVPRHSDAHVAIKLCLVAAIALLVLSCAKTSICWAANRRIAAGATHVFEAVSIGIGCDPTASPQIAKSSGNYTRTARNIRLENARDLATLSRAIAREKIDCVYVSSVWTQTPAVTRYLSALQNSTCRMTVLPTSCPLDARPGGELTVRAPVTSIGVALDRSGAWLARAHDAGLAVLALCIVSV
jgi:hypothetical protein